MLKAMIWKYDIRELTSTFNLDEYLFLRKMKLCWTKCILKTGAQSIMHGAKFRGKYEHFTVMSLVTATGQIMTPFVVLLGVEAK